MIQVLHRISLKSNTAGTAGHSFRQSGRTIIVIFIYIYYTWTDPYLSFFQISIYKITWTL